MCASIASVFFFSSRRRHTRFDCDWSSDVCSSDLSSLPGSRRVLRRGPTNTTVGCCGACGVAFEPPQVAAKHVGSRVTLRSEEHTSELQSQSNLVCRLLLEKKNSSTHSHRTVRRRDR